MLATQHSDLNIAITHLQSCINELTNWYSMWKLRDSQIEARMK
jgi:hypothetical protein